MGFTADELKVIEAYKIDDHVLGHGWDTRDAAAWVKDFYKQCNLTPRVFKFSLNALVKNEIMFSNGDTFNLTPKGRELVKGLDPHVSRLPPAKNAFNCFEMAIEQITDPADAEPICRGLKFYFGGASASFPGLKFDNIEGISTMGDTLEITIEHGPTITLRADGYCIWK